MESPPKTAKVCCDQEDSDSELSPESDESDVNNEQHCGETEQNNKVEAPVELKGEVCQCCMICSLIVPIITVCAWSKQGLALLSATGNSGSLTLVPCQQVPRLVCAVGMSHN